MAIHGCTLSSYVLRLTLIGRVSLYTLIRNFDTTYPGEDFNRQKDYCYSGADCDA